MKIPDTKALYQLFKPGLSLAVVLTLLPTLLSGPQLPSVTTLLATVAGTLLSAMAAFGFNQVIEHDRDAKMDRTRHRILVTGQATKRGVSVFSIVLLAAGLLILGFQSGILAMTFALASFLIYVFPYTWLKPKSSFNTIVGAFSGAVGPLIGDATANGTVTWFGWLLFAFLFLWQPPHFWALACYRKDDYARGGFVMLPVEKGIRYTSIQMVVYYALLTGLLTVSFYPLQFTNIVFFVTAVPFSFLILVYMIRFAKSQNLKTARIAFFLSIFHNMLWHGVLTFEQLSRHFD